MKSSFRPFGLLPLPLLPLRSLSSPPVPLLPLQLAFLESSSLFRCAVVKVRVRPSPEDDTEFRSFARSLTAIPFCNAVVTCVDLLCENSTRDLCHFFLILSDLIDLE